MVFSLRQMPNKVELILHGCVCGHESLSLSGIGPKGATEWNGHFTEYRRIGTLASPRPTVRLHSGARPISDNQVRRD